MRGWLPANSVDIWTDGSSTGDDLGPGGYAAILIFQDREEEIVGGDPKTTHQRMELLAAIAALESLTSPHQVVLYTDSAYVGDCFVDGWWRTWLTNSWRNSKGKPVANRDLWVRLLLQNAVHRIVWRRVPGHDANYPLNGRCDELANAAKVQFIPEAA